MKNRIFAIAFLVTVVAPSAIASSVNYQWDGKWIGIKGRGTGILLVKENRGVIDIVGTDNGAVYRAVCIAKSDMPNTASCVGSGESHENGINRFIYRSEIRDNGDGSITETWDIEFHQASKKGIAEYVHSSRASK